MGRTPLNGGTAFRFLPSEVVDMEKALDASAGATPARSIVEGLADKFTNSTERNGQRPVQWKQVWNWFQNRRHAQKAKIAKTPDKLKPAGSGSETPPTAKIIATATAAATPVQSAVKKQSDAPMDFEAKSARDGAWYDVSTFVSKRTGESGVAEVRVRFAGFGSEEDEWVDITTAVRQRSLPCETTECVAVIPGDLILCFQEGNEQALYFDADILDVQRRRHDVRGCRCRFWVRYRHDSTEEVVPLRKVCRRPETDQRLQQAKDAAASTSKIANIITTDTEIKVDRVQDPNIGTNICTPATAPAIPTTPNVTPGTTTYVANNVSAQMSTPIQPGVANNASAQMFTPVQPGVANNASAQMFTPVQPGVANNASAQMFTPVQPGVANNASAQTFTPVQLGVASAQTFTPVQLGVASAQTFTPVQLGVSLDVSLPNITSQASTSLQPVATSKVPMETQPNASSPSTGVALGTPTIAAAANVLPPNTEQNTHAAEQVNIKPIVVVDTLNNLAQPMDTACDGNATSIANNTCGVPGQPQSVSFSVIGAPGGNTVAPETLNSVKQVTSDEIPMVAVAAMHIGNDGAH